MRLIKTTLYEDLQALPPRLVGEIISGQLYAHPRPSSKHALTLSCLGAEILGPYSKGRGGPGGWWILDEPQMHLDGNVIVPDLAGWRRERLTQIPDGYMTVVPDWVCEIASIQSFDVQVKMPLYESLGVPYLWLVHPLEKWISAYVLSDFGYQPTVHASEGAISAPPFDQISIELKDLF